MYITALTEDRRATPTDRRQGRRRSSDGENLDPVEAATREAARKNLIEVKQQIHAKSMALHAAAPRDIPALTHELQRLRVSMLMLREIVDNIADPSAHRELALLTKMTDAADIEADDARKEQEAGEEAAAERLREVGLTPERAGAMVSVLRALGTIMSTPPPSLLDDDGSPSRRSVS